MSLPSQGWVPRLVVNSKLPVQPSVQPFNEPQLEFTFIKMANLKCNKWNTYLYNNNNNDIKGITEHNIRHFYTQYHL